MSTEPIEASAYTTDKIHLPTSSFGKVSPKTRARAAERGEAMKDGSFPIRDGADLKRAIAAYGRAKDKGAAKRHIMRRARALDKVSLLPSAWQEAANQQFSHVAPDVKPAESPVDVALREKADKHNGRVGEEKQVTLPKLRVVYKRGLMASASSLGVLTPEQQAHARVNSFLRLLQNGRPDNPEYTQDDDLLPAPPPFSFAASDGGALLARGADIPWVEADHPRDQNGKWIKKFGRLKWRAPGGDWDSGTAVGFQADMFTIKKDDGSLHKVPVEQTLYTKAVARLDAPDLGADEVDLPEPSKMRPATSEDRKRLKIPPAWTNVVVAEDPNSELQAQGRDSKNRLQSRYSDAHDQRVAEEKFARMRELHNFLPALDEALGRDAETDGTAAAVYLMRTMGIRNGSETDTGADKFAYGATNLRARHILVDGDNVTLDFDSKDNQHITLPVTDERLKSILRARKDGKGDDDQIFGTNGAKTNAYLKKHTRDDFMIKDLRTYYANQEAIAIVASMPKPQTAAEFKKARMDVGRQVAALLGNTPTIALKSYISPAVFNTWLIDAPWLR